MGISDAVRPSSEPWRRNLYVLRLTGFGHYLGNGFAMPLLPLYLGTLGVPLGEVAFWAGLAYSISPLLNALTGPAWGHLADRFGPKLMLERSLLVAGSAAALVGLVGMPEQVVAARALVGLVGGFTVASITAVTTSAPRRELSRALGSFQAAQTLGAVIGPLAGGVLADTLGLRIAFLVSGVAFLPIIVAVHLVYRDIPPGTLEEPEAATGVGRASSEMPLLAMLATAPLLVVCMGALYALNVADSGLAPLLPLYLAATGAPPENLATVAGATTSAASLAAAVAAYTLGRAGPRLGVYRTLLALLLAGSVISLGLSLAPTWWAVALGRFALGLVVGGGPALAYATAAVSVPTARRGAAMGFMTSTGLLGLASGPLAAGAVARISLSGVFVANAAIYVLAAATLAFRRPRPSESPAVP